MDTMQILKEAGIDLETTLGRFSGNQEMMERFIKKFPSDPGMGKLERAVEEKSYDDVFKQAHTLKGTSATLGMQTLSRCCAAIVQATRENAYETIQPLFEQVKEEYQKLVTAISQID